MEASGADVIASAWGRIENDLRGHQRDLLSLHGLAALKKLPTQPGQKILIGLHRSYGVRNFETHLSERSGGVYSLPKRRYRSQILRSPF